MKAVGETRHVAVDMRGKLDTGEDLTGTPTIVEVTTAHLTLSNKAISDEDLTINGDTVPAAQAVQFTVSGGTAGISYTIRITVATTLGQTIIENLSLGVVANS